MYWYKEFRQRELEILTAITPKYFTLGLNIHWNRITQKQIEELSRNCYVFDFHFLCFDLSMNVWGKLNDED